jgi:hydrogenase-4 component B
VVGGIMSETLIVWGIAVAGISGVPGLLARRTSMIGQWVSTLLAVVGSALGLGGVGWFWTTGISEPIARPWLIPGAEFSVAIDGLSAIFLAPIFLIALLANIYGLAYWPQTDHPENGRRLRLFYGTMTAGMALLVIARNSILFLYGWEIMALSSFFLVGTESHQKEAREAAWLYLVATHCATLCLFALFALLRTASGSFALVPLGAGELTPAMATVVFALALAAFGMKAGIMPLHIWLPSAHAVAPSHVSAIMSGVLIKMGIYGFLRVTSLLPNPPLEWGAVIVGFGAVSGVLGVALAIGQRDLKRILAYSSIENIGIIFLGVGLALLGRSLGRDDWILLGLGGSLFHVWNHGIFKALLFLSAGSVIHATHTRDVDVLGGLAKTMRSTGIYFLIGAVAICGLPPLNGFIGEFLLYLGLFATLGQEGEASFAAIAFAAPALALMGALSLACFVRVYGVVFLGSARSEHARHAHESSLSMLGPMSVLAFGCFLIGLAPRLVVPMIEQGISAWAPGLKDAGPRLIGLAPLDSISAVGLGILAAILALGAIWRVRLRYSHVTRASTWGCSYAAPTPRMQYTASSFGQMLVGLFGWALRPRLVRPAKLALFAEKTVFQSEVPDVVLDEALVPAFRWGSWLLTRLRVFQQGNVQTYLLYLFLALIALLLWR